MNEPFPSMRDAFGKKLAELCTRDAKVIALDGDLGNSTKLSIVEEQAPQSFYQMGIAEQNMVGVAAGLATVGFQPWVCSFASFLTKRAYDQIVVSIDQPGLNVKLVGAYSGILTSNTGKTHHALDDIALMSMLPNMTVIAPGDAREAEKAIEAIYQLEGPVYLRLTRDDSISPFMADRPFVIGKGVVLHEGTDIALISTGSMSYRAKLTTDLLVEEGINVQLLHLPTLKPFDEDAVLAAAAKVGCVMTVEEHYTRGGLGSMVAELLSERHPTKVVRVGVDGCYSECGPNEDLLEKHGLSVPRLVERVKAALQCE